MASKVKVAYNRAGGLVHLQLLGRGSIAFCNLKVPRGWRYDDIITADTPDLCLDCCLEYVKILIRQ